MIVAELIKILRDCEQSAHVYVGTLDTDDDDLDIARIEEGLTWISIRVKEQE